ncbi:hypothetical protein A471_15995 [Ectopseudomonas mendocina DLHK]|nr:hypothetical protein A471_15995 [Pseudomonas mendocina DLHK]
MKQLKRVSRDLALALPFAALSTMTFAAGWDYSAVMADIDFGTIATGVLAVAALLAVVYAGIKGAKIVLGFLRG